MIGVIKSRSEKAGLNEESEKSRGWESDGDWKGTERLEKVAGKSTHSQRLTPTPSPRNTAHLSKL